MPNTKTYAGTSFPAELVPEMFNAVRGHSALAKLSAGKPIAFAGATEFVFSADGEAALVGEGAAKPAGDATVTSVVIRPVKFVYQHRVSDEFVKSATNRLNYLEAFAEGFARKIARAFDIAAMHGLEPATGAPASFRATNSLDGLIAVPTPATADIEADLTNAISAVKGAGREVTGVAFAPGAADAMAAIKVSGVPQYPEFRFGQNVDYFYGMNADVNSTVSFDQATALYVGDFQGAFKWGYAQEIPMEVIQYGDPDGQGDLKLTNEVVLRAEAYIGWGILDADSFGCVVSGS